jgi:excinuclease UvrABC ATPase subunit
MIDEQETRLQFGYYSESLSRGSNKEVYAICDDCGFTRIMKFNSYNTTKGRCQSCTHKGKHHTEETKRKISKNHVDNSGENHSMFGKHHTEEAKCKMLKNHANVSGENSPMFGRHHTEEAKNKMSERKQGMYNGDKNPNFGKFGKKSANWKGGKKLVRARVDAKRRKLFGFIPHNKPQENFHGHHLDFNHVIFIPVELHRSIWHSVTKNINMDLINDVACDWYLIDQGVKL